MKSRSQHNVTFGRVISSVPPTVRLVIGIIVVLTAWYGLGSILRGCDSSEVSRLRFENERLRTERRHLERDIDAMEIEIAGLAERADRLHASSDSLKTVMAAFRSTVSSAADTTYSGSNDELGRELDSLFSARIGVNFRTQLWRNDAYVFPKPAAVDYRNLILETIPGFERIILSQDQIIHVDSLEIVALREQVALHGVTAEKLLLMQSMYEEELWNRDKIEFRLERLARSERRLRKVLIVGGIAVGAVVGFHVMY